MSLVYELLDKKDKIRSSDSDPRLSLPQRSLVSATKKKPRSIIFRIVASLAFIFSLAALAGGWHLYESVRAIQTDYMALDATLIQVSQRVQTLDDETSQLRADFSRLGQQVKQNAGQNEKLKLEVEHSQIEIEGIKKNLQWVLNVNKDLQEEVQKLNVKNSSLKNVPVTDSLASGSR